MVGKTLTGQIASTSEERLILEMKKHSQSKQSVHRESSCKVESKFGKLTSNLSLRAGGLRVFGGKGTSSPKIGFVSFNKDREAEGKRTLL